MGNYFDVVQVFCGSVLRHREGNCTSLSINVRGSGIGLYRCLCERGIVTPGS